ncbi:hypothetical protein [Cupriavidus sp. YR651]|uniref:hypothetical protein n=1 Tax=Cupriavidus sp. YR651 TaxID=1855315 RepID=UPI00115FCFD8|nr:hypothetical protein [Cupriavidus sp. YR651]
MSKLEIKLTLTEDSTPELLRYLRGISSARDRAFILKRLATCGLNALGNGGAEAALLPAPPTVTAAVLAANATVPAGATPFRPELTPPSTEAMAPSPAAVRIVVDPVPASTGSPPSNFEHLDLGALNAATDQFA